MLYLSRDSSSIKLSTNLYVHLYNPLIHKPPPDAVASLIDGVLSYQFSEQSRIIISQTSSNYELRYTFVVGNVDVFVVAKTTFAPVLHFLSYAVSVSNTICKAIEHAELDPELFPHYVGLFQAPVGTILAFSRYGIDVEVLFNAENIDNVLQQLITLFREYDIRVLVEADCDSCEIAT